jgi:uncharacterized protein YdaU (DUF1376 family)
VKENKSPAYSRYPQDFISSMDCQLMTLEELGAYNLLLDNSWIQETQCYLPNNLKSLAKLLRISEKKMKKLWKNILQKKFKVTENGEHIYNERLLQEYHKQLERKEKQSRGGKKGMAHRWDK